MTRITDIKKRCEQATEGSAWKSLCRFVVTPNASEWDSEFIAHSREDIPYLLSQLEARDMAIEKAREALEEIKKVHLEASTRPGGYVSVSSQIMCNKAFEAIVELNNLLPSPSER